MKRLLCIIICLILAALPAGCGKGKEPDASKAHIYYINMEGTALVKKGYDLRGDSPEEEIENILKDMKKEPESIEYKSAFPKETAVTDWSLEDGKLDMYFSAGYAGMDAAAEVLLRSAVVQSLVQIAGVDYVDFFVDNNPLTDKEGNEIGYMRAEDFVKNTGSSIHSYQLANLNLYFANDKGDKLVKQEVSVRYNSNISVEKLIVEQLIKGPSADGSHPVIPPETKLLGISVKDNTCYVNFDEGFLGTGYGVNPNLTIYSLVNSLVEGGDASQVQISVNGETGVMYQSSVDLSKPLSRDLDIVEEE